MFPGALELAAWTKSCHMSRPPPGSVCGEEQDLAAAHISPSAESAYCPETLPGGPEVTRALGRSRFGSGLCQSLGIQGLASLPRRGETLAFPCSKKKEREFLKDK